MCVFSDCIFTVSELTRGQHESTERVWGAAYHIPAAKVPEVREYLYIREINGYSIQFTPFVPADASKPINTLVYIGLPSNPQFLGPQDPDALARHILKSRGPSGENREYLFQLEEALNGLGDGSRDTHISDLVRRCREIEKEKEAELEGDVTVNGACGPLHKVGGTEEQEEVER
jgi:cation transport regulator ChaC